MWDVIGCGGRGVRDSGLAENWNFGMVALWVWAG